MSTAAVLATPIPWLAPPPSAMSVMIRGLGAAAAMFAGLAVIGVAFAWTGEMSPPVQVTLTMFGMSLVAASLIFTTPPQT